MIKHIVKPMQRGQVTIPQEIRDHLGITQDTYLWVKTTPDKRIIIEPVLDASTTTESTNDQGLWLSTIDNNPAFDFLHREPDLYSENDGTPYEPEA